MKKINLLIAGIFIIALVTSLILLLSVYKFDKDCLGYELCLSVFTGCVFAFPSGAIFLAYECYSIKRKSSDLISDIYSLLESMSTELKTTPICFSSVETKRTRLVSLHDRLEETWLGVIQLKKADIRDLLEKLFDISIKLVKANNLSALKANPKKINNTIDDSVTLIEGSITLIKKIQKLK